MKPSPNLRSWHPLGSAGLFRKDPVAFFKKLEALDMPLVEFRLAILRCTYLNSASAIKYAMQTNLQNFSKGGIFYQTAQEIVGDGLVFLNGEVWKNRRMALNPLFYKQSIESYFEVMCQQASALCQKWDTAAAQNQPVNAVEDIHYSAFSIGAQTLFGTGLYEQEIQTLIREMDFMLVEVKRRTEQGISLPLFVPTPKNIRLKRSMRTFDSLVTELIARQSSENQQYTLISLLQHIKDEATGKPALSEKNIKDEIKVFFVAGTDTSTHSLAWTLYLLAKHPVVLRKLQQEIDTVVGAESLTLAHTEALEYTEQVLQEAMRLYPPAWLISRSVETDDQVEGFSIRKHTNVFISPYMLHRHPNYWVNPDAFEPERFAAEQKASIPKDAYIPFGIGGRKCIGFRFAMLEMKTILTLLVQRFEWQIPLPDQVKAEFSSTLKPQNLQLLIQSRL
ncbi:cytochrome P450 [Eisenibacter elegans]|jgi:cytochrome P450|uniref:cytochrome P450 n=1 Tax=Eisenibacter elegans TaxID=997 RepID=UPI0004090EC7|nr:cytochrome P450 [Eisenibacter elegans]